LLEQRADSICGILQSSTSLIEYRGMDGLRIEQHDEAVYLARGSGRRWIQKHSRYAGARSVIESNCRSWGRAIQMESMVNGMFEHSVQPA
jgi:hypothetical protein